ncbi:MAG: formate/nitrite transporter family protein [Bacilli bacterium]|nr:formate/nitrite transporter family protein [Bacilli bacterium]
MKYLKIALSSLIAGFIMALAGFELVAMEANNAFVAGAFLQGFGLLLVTYFNLELYNCHVCELITGEKKLERLLTLLMALVINLATIIGVAYLCRLASNEKESFIIAAEKFTNARIISINGSEGKAWYMALVNGIMCGIICYIGAYFTKKSTHPFVRILGPFFAVGLFVVCGFENLMTNAFYIAYAHALNANTILDLVMVFLGNSIGAILTYYAFRFIESALANKGKMKSKK